MNLENEDTTIDKLLSLPRTKVPQADLLRIKNQVLDRISIPREVPAGNWSMALLANLSRAMKITGSVIAICLVAFSMTVGTAVAALESLPGDTLYPLKKVVENIQLRMADTEEQRANLQIKLANKRLEELEEVLQKSEQGEISASKAEKIVSQTIQSLEKTTAAASNATSKTGSNVDMLVKIVTLSTKQETLLKSASISTEGQIKIDAEKALETSQISKEQAIENIERAGLIVEDQPLLIDDSEVKTTGKLTEITTESISLGTAKFLLNDQTKYINVKAEELKIDQLVEITGMIEDNITYATIITLIKSDDPTVIEK